MPPPPPSSSAGARPTPAYPTRQTANYRRGKRAANPMKRRHWYTGLIIICGWILPPLAVAVRFGIGLDFFINVILTCCGYIPGHGHNFWIQNIRNNQNKKHSPAWAVRAGLVKDHRKAKAQKRQWAGRYDDDGVVGGTSHYGRQRWENQAAIADPITGETKRESPFSGGLPAAPWQSDPDAPSGRGWDDDLPGEKPVDRFARSKNDRRGRRDSVTGAWIEEDDDDLLPTTSDPSSAHSSGNGSVQEKVPRRPQKKKAPLQQQYAERYGFSRSSLSTPSDSARFPRDLAGSNDALDRELQGASLAPRNTAPKPAKPYDYVPNDGLDHQF